MMKESRNLDMLRAFAVLCVFFAHIRQFVVPLPFQLYQMARFGVLVFFVHTCLVLLQSLDRSSYGPIETALNFYVRRVFRIYPLSILTVLAMVMWSIPRQPDVRYEWLNARELFANITLTQNLGHVVSSPVTLWSLPWEIQMYLVLPALFFWFRRSAMWTGMALWLAAVLLARSLDQWIVFKFSPSFIGGLIAYQGLKGRPQRQLAPYMWPVALLAVAAFHAVWWRTYQQGLGGYMSCLILGILIPLFREQSESWLTRGSHAVAKYSYGIYLVHIPAIWLAFVKLAAAPVLLQWMVLVVLSTGLPIVLYHFIEAPLINLGRTLAETVCRRQGPQRYRVAQAAD